MLRSIMLAVFYLLGYSLQGQHPGYGPLMDTAVFDRQFSAASEKIHSIRCDFVQEKNLAMLSEKIVSKGKFWFKKDKQVRMEYEQPYPYLVIINNNKMFIKDGQKETKVSLGSNKLIKQINGLIIDCIQGTSLHNPDFRVKVFENKQDYLVELMPAGTQLKDFLKHIDITIDKKDYTATAIEMFELSGDNTLIYFNNREINISIPDALFSLK
jgi:outer membrane lipoprotein-sorting protein